MKSVREFLEQILGSERSMRKIWDAAHSKMVDGSADSAQRAFTEAMLDYYDSTEEETEHYDSTKKAKKERKDG